MKGYLRAIFLAGIFIFGIVAGTASGDVLFTVSDYLTSAIGVIDANGAVGLRESFADGNPWMIPFNDGASDKLIVALRGAGTLRLYDQKNLSSPVWEEKIGANIQSGLFFGGKIFILDMGDIMSNKGDAKLFKMDSNGNVEAEINLQASGDEYKFFAEKILESGGALFVLLQRYKMLSVAPWTEHREGKLVKIAPDTLTITKEWPLNKNPMDMVMFGGEAYIPSVGRAQGVSGNTQKLEVVNIATESKREISLWPTIPAEMNEPQKITASASHIYIAVSSVENPATYQTKSAIYKFDPNDISTLAQFASFPNGSVTSMAYNPSDGSLMALFSDYSNFWQGDIKIYSQSGVLTKNYSSAELGGSAYQAVLASGVPGGSTTFADNGGGCNAVSTNFWGVLMLILFVIKSPLPPFSKGGKCAVLCLAMTSAAFAEVVELPAETVTASRIQEAADYSPGSVTIIEARELVGSVQDLPSLLERVPGLRVVQLRGRGQYAVASVRGSTASQVAIYIDGQLASLGSDTAMNLAEIPVENLERVEVYRGYIPARFGVAGLGGAINIVTRAVEKSGGTVGFGVGSLGQKQANFSWAGKLAGGDFFFGSQYEGYKGNFSYHNDNATPTNPADDYTADRRNNAFDRGGALLKWQKDGWALRGEWNRNLQELARSAPGNDKPGELDGASMTTDKLDFRVSKRLKVGAADMGFAAAWLGQERKFDDPNLAFGSGRHNKYKTDRWAFDYDVAAAAGERHFLEFFANYTDEKLNIEVGNSNFSSQHTNLTLQDTIALDEAGTLLLSPLVRWNNADGDNAATWNIAISKQLRGGWLLRGSYGSYVRIPNLYERYGDGGMLRATPGLEWERGEQFDMGLVWSGKLWGGAGSFGATYFNRNSRDLIEFVMFGPYTAAYRNIGKASVRGVELEGSWSRGRWGAEFAATYTDSKNETDDYRNGKRLPNSPEWTAFARLNHDFSKRFAVFTEVRHTSKNFLDYAQYILNDRVTTVGVGAKWKFADNATLFANVNDLFDNSADSQFIHALTGRRELAWYPGAGRTFTLSVRWEF